MVSVFGDDSADETQQRVFAVAGVIATDYDWMQLESSRKERTNGVSFHATDWDSDQKDYATTSHSENKQLYRDLVHILANSKAWGFGAAIELSSFRDFGSTACDCCESDPFGPLGSQHRSGCNFMFVSSVTFSRVSDSLTSHGSHWFRRDSFWPQRRQTRM
jgi:hypothetical protein